MEEEVKKTPKTKKKSAVKEEKETKTAKASKTVAKKETKSEVEKDVKVEKAEKVTKPKKEEVKEKVKNEAKKTKKTSTKSEKSDKKTAEKKTTKKEEKVKEEPYDILDIEGYHHLKLYSYVYDKIKNPKAVVLIVHGMMEHAFRYDNFARFLNDNGYYVIANDLRGHGHTAVDKKFGMGEKDIFQETVQDEIVMLEKIKDAYNLPVYLFGHSYGSMISQAIIQNTDIVEKCVLCGTANGSSGIMKMGGSFTKFLSLFKGDTAKAGVVENMCIKNYGKKFENGNWLTRDENVFKAYQEDEFCGGTFPFGFYKSMLTNMKKINAGINKIGNKKIFLIAGEKDPVGSCGKQVVALNKRYLSNNIDSRVKIYPECRHELINELNKEEVYNDILDFYNS